jgi:hypothetical protein
LAAAAVGFWYYATRPTNGVRADDLRADLEARLPPGSSGSDIEAWFRDHGINDVADMTDIGQQKVGYRAVIPNDTLVERVDIEIICRTDRAGRLASASVDRVPRTDPR